MSVSLAVFINNVLNELDLDANTNLPVMLAGSDSTTLTITAAQTIIKFLDDAVYAITREAFPVAGSVTYSSLPANTLSIQLQNSNLVSADGLNSVMWHTQVVLWNSQPLQSCGRDRLALQFPSFVSDASGTPKYWCEDGGDSIMIYPRPSTPQNLTLTGLVTPGPTSKFVTAATNASPIQITTNTPHNYVTGQQVVIAGVAGNTAANGTFTITKVDASNFTLNGVGGTGAYTGGGFAYSPTATIPLIPDDLQKMLEAFVCMSIASKVLRDSLMQERIGIWDGRYHDDKIRLLDQLWNTNPDLARAAFAPMHIWRGRVYNR